MADTTSQPVNPFTVNMTFPMYDGERINTTLADIDSWTYYNARLTTNYSILFGVCLMAVIHLVALTPAPKRRLPLFTFTILTLVFEMLRMILGIYYTNYSRFDSMYFNLSGTLWDDHLIREGDIVASVMSNLAPPLAFFCIQVVLYIQASSVLKAMERKLYQRMILGFLVILGAVTFVHRFAFAILYMNQTVKKDVPQFNYGPWERTALALYSASIFSWSIVFSVNVAIAIVSRFRMGIKKNDAMTILLLTGLESMVLPVFFCILQLVGPAWFPQPDLCIVPSIACLLPVGSLWASSANTAARSSPPAIINNDHRRLVGNSDSSARSGATTPGTPGSKPGLAYAGAGSSAGPSVPTLPSVVPHRKSSASASVLPFEHVTPEEYHRFGSIGTHRLRNLGGGIAMHVRAPGKTAAAGSMV